jgi:hypothetical protein
LLFFFFIPLGGVAGGSKYVVHNILFKFAIDEDGLYGNDDAAAAKVGGVCYLISIAKKKRLYID